MKNFIYNEMMTHVGLCTSKEPSSVLIISDEPGKFEAEVAKHDNIKTTAIACKLEDISALSDGEFDLIINEMEPDTLFLAQLNRVAKKDAQLTTVHPSLDAVNENKKLISELSRYFKIVMPFNISAGTTALLCSKEYHPTADINLQRADMLDNLSYYNCDVHVGSFAMGNYIRKEYLGVIKN